MDGFCLPSLLYFTVFQWSPLLNYFYVFPVVDDLICVFYFVIIKRLSMLYLLPQSSVGSFSQRLWLGVSASSLSLYKQGEVEPFENIQYRQITSFGVSDSSIFKVSVGEKEMTFETSKVSCRFSSTFFESSYVFYSFLTTGRRF